ncbi:MAG: polyprenyl synthetase family protein [Opitutaceae bacterium]
MSEQPTAVDSDFKAKFSEFGRQVEVGIDRYLPATTTPPGRLHEAMRYSMEAGGKRLRPVLLLGVHQALAGRLDPLPAAVALECLHTYSLIHDDLPAMDDGDLRRGRPSCHRQFDEATAILAGDALLTHAFALLARAYRTTPEVAVQLIDCLGTAAGSERLIGGQMDDLLAEKTEINAEQLDSIHLNKTAALMSAAAAMGAIVAQAPAGSRETASALGRHLGLAFQIIDDVLDATGTSETLGKEAGSDQTAGKSTYVSLHGLEEARKAARSETASALEQCRELGGPSAFLEDLVRMMENRIH